MEIFIFHFQWVISFVNYCYDLEVDMLNERKTYEHVCIKKKTKNTAVV